ncbi:MAG: hypothetical protein EHM61_28575, partial [Acidobacteria bacterium]
MLCLLARTRALVVPTVVISFLLAVAVAQEIELPRPPQTGTDQFGRSSDIDGTRAIVGAPAYRSGGFATAGAAFVYRNDPGGWIQEAALSAFGSYLDAGDNFGLGVAISGTKVVVGAYSDEHNGSLSSGSAYVFSLNPGTGAWDPVRLVADDYQANSNYGYAVDISGDDIIVGAYNHDVGSPLVSNVGTAWIYHFDGTNWVQQGKLLPPVGDRVASQRFGYSVAIDGDMALVGAAGPNGSIGKAYSFRRTGGVWEEPVELPRSVSPVNSGYGQAVALDLPSAVVGANAHSSPPSGQGAAFFYQYDGSNWTQTGLVQAPNLEALSYFGFSTAIHGDWALIGGRADSLPGFTSAGSVSLYHWIGAAWTYDRTLTATTRTASANFGGSVGYDGTNAVIGAYGRDSWRGAASIFQNIGDPPADVSIVKTLTTAGPFL